MANKAGAALPPAGYGPGCAAAAGCVGQDTYVLFLTPACSHKKATRDSKQ